VPKKAQSTDDTRKKSPAALLPFFIYNRTLEAKDTTPSMSVSIFLIT